MKALRVLATATVLSAIAGSALAADEIIVTEEGVSTFSFFKPAAVRAEVGTTGYGGAISWNANPYVGVTLGYNGGDISWSDDIKVDGIKYDLDMDNKLAYLNAEIRPWANWFYTALGVGYTDNQYELTGRPDGKGTYKINGNDYYDYEVGRLEGKVSYKNNIAPYVGVGFSPAITNRWGVFGELGAYYTGNPNASLQSIGGTRSEELNAQGGDVAEARRKVEEKDKFEWMPVAKLGVSFRF
ncbi:putative carbapenem-associated resistance outer membrane -like protein [Acinetobacter sp. 263903-1]|uniref:ornithine uptake porin CarO n=1 Tax=Acinetobacter TaxID=469 RepID=UPI0002E743C5|nr:MULTISPECIES: ornithine uptake porin CarO [Acinetobacter]KCX37965.1 putative carbapenem-associated resistance outer membrane -like protein [Acinetobacter sp. 263903-1]